MIDEKVLWTDDLPYKITPPGQCKPRKVQDCQIHALTRQYIPQYGRSDFAVAGDQDMKPTLGE